MADQKAIDYIKSAREKDGLSNEVIKRNLLSVGWEEEEINEIFQALDGVKDGPVAEFPREEKHRTDLPRVEEPAEKFFREKGFIEKPKKLQFNKKYLIPLIILVVFISLVSASAFVYNQFFRKIDPISLLPQETALYLRVKINPENKQVENFKELLNKFPYYEKFSQKISDGFEILKEKEPNLKHFDFTISDEIIFAIISPFEERMEQFPLIFILPDPDLKKLEKLSKDIQNEIERSGAWKIEKETYRGRIIVRAVPTYQSNLSGPRLEPSTTLTDGHFILATKPEDIKKIIDIAEDQKIINIFRGGKEKNIYSNAAYRKIKKYLPKNYLALFYGELDFSKMMKIPGVIGVVAKTEDFFGPLADSLKAALDLPFFKKKESEESEKIAMAWAIIAEKNELTTETYSLDLRDNIFISSQFSFEESLAGFIPEKIENKEIVFYGEGRNLKSSFEYLEETLTKQMTTEEKREYNDSLKFLRETLGIDIKEDILALFDKNYAFFLASEPTGKETPIVAFILEVDDENKAKENLLKISISPIPLISLTSPSLPSLSPEQIPQEKIGFKKEIIDGFEIYSLPVYEEFGLNFSIKERKAIFTFTKEGLISTLKSLSDSKQRRLKDSKLFAEQFEKIPKNITGISYSYPYGYLGTFKWVANFILDFYKQRFESALGGGILVFEAEKLQTPISEFLDKGITPYLKVLKSVGSYSYSPESGLSISKGRFIIEELSVREKETTEEFWENIGGWVEENFGPIFGFPMVPIY